ncbi:hypothetical protein RJT34_25138 [Clitoria ternatea]|uniref:Uncharacterized protein n=1 Tax=Clitoria ternatea TaxID=43366 RepID=A0AAN9ILD6_CLITE
MNSYQSLFGKEKPGGVRYLGRIITPTILKKNEEIVVIKKQHASEIASLESKVGVMQNEMDGLKSIVKCLLGQSIPRVDIDALATRLGCNFGDANSAPDVPSHGEV